MSLVDEYRAALSGLPDPEPFALAHSGLPGARGNLELIAVLAETADEATLRRGAALSPEEAPGDQPPVVLAVAGIVGLGRFLADRPDVLALLHAYAGDPRWRVREGVAMALQRGGAADPAALIVGLEPWVLDADPLVQRAVVAALCEPALLVDEAVATRVVAVLDEVTVSLLGRADRRAEGVWVLRQALGYGWSVAIVAAPGAGMRAFERWIADTDPDARWIVRENLGKVRLAKPDPVWVAAALRRVQLSSPGS